MKRQGRYGIVASTSKPFKSCSFSKSPLQTLGPKSTSHFCFDFDRFDYTKFWNFSRIRLTFKPPVSDMCRSTMLLIFSLLIAHISSLSGQEARFGHGTSLGCIILFLVASVPGLPQDQLFKRVSTISSREVGHF